MFSRLDLDIRAERSQGARVSSWLEATGKAFEWRIDGTVSVSVSVSEEWLEVGELNECRCGHLACCLGRCRFMCKARWSLLAKERSHTAHLNGFAPVCFR